MRQRIRILSEKLISMSIILIPYEDLDRSRYFIENFVPEKMALYFRV